MFETLFASSGAGAALGFIVYAAVIILEIAGLWKVFTKAGEPGWAAIIPIYNTIVLLRIVGRPIWWFILLLIPLVNIIVLIMVMFDLAKAFGKGAGYAIGLILLSFIFIPLLGFGDAQYQGAGNRAGATI
ncbi:MAG: signal peptidase I [Chloroflexi bacterium]|nr:MAG: signal peptidase I [Chloroflexota bacterium]